MMEILATTNSLNEQMKTIYIIYYCSPLRYRLQRKRDTEFQIRIPSVNFAIFNVYLVKNVWSPERLLKEGKTKFVVYARICCRVNRFLVL